MGAKTHPLTAVETAVRRKNHLNFVNSLKWPVPACKCADPYVVHRILSVAFRQIGDGEWKERGLSPNEAAKLYVPDEAVSVATLILLPRFKYYKLAKGGVDDEHPAPSVLDSDPELLRMLLDVRIGNWPSLAHVLAELLRSEAVAKTAPGFRGRDGRHDAVDAYEAVLEIVQTFLHKALGQDHDIVPYDESLAVHVFFHKAMKAALTAVSMQDWELLWSSPIARGFHLMLVGYCENLTTYAKQCHHLDYDGGYYRPTGACGSNIGWNASLDIELTPEWFWRLVHAGLIDCPRARRHFGGVDVDAFDLDDPAWANEVAAARRVKLLYEHPLFDARSPDQPIWSDVCANDMPLLYCLPAPLTDHSRAACSRRFTLEEWLGLQRSARRALLRTPRLAARGGRVVRGVSLLTNLPYTEAIAGLEPWARDAVQRLRRLELAGHAPTPWKRNCAFRIQRAFRRRRAAAAAAAAAPPPAPLAGVAEETERLLNHIVIGVEGIESDGPSVLNWWWKRPRRIELAPMAISLQPMPMLELARAASEKLLERRAAGWPLLVTASTGAAIVEQLVRAVEVQLTRVHADDATGKVPRAHVRSLEMWKLVAERRMKNVLYVHFVHPIRRMAWAIRRIVLCWRAHVLARATQSHLYALSIHQHSFMLKNLERCEARGIVCSRVEMEATFLRVLGMHPAVGPTLLDFFKCAKLPNPDDETGHAVYSIIHALLRNRDLSDSVRSTAYIRESLATARKQWARYPDRDDGGNRWRADRWRWNADGKWKPAPEPIVCWGCGKSECKRRAEQRAWDDRWDGGHAVRVALRLGDRTNGDPSGVLAVLRPVPVLKLRAVEREGEAVLRPYAGAELPEPFTFKMLACPCARCEKLERGARARYHDVACQAADWPRHKRGAAAANVATRA